jgi:hypothetical protein
MLFLGFCEPRGGRPPIVGPAVASREPAISRSFPLSCAQASCSGRTKAEVLPQLPPKIRTVIELQPVGGMRRIVRQEMDLYRARHLRLDSDAINWDDLSKVRHQTALAKVPLVVDYIIGITRRHDGQGVAEEAANSERCIE